MKKLKAVVFAAVLAITVTGCGQQAKTGAWSAEENSIYVNRGLAIESALVYTSEKENDTYSQEELKTFIEESVTEYNEANGGIAAAANTEGQAKLPVALKSCKLEGNTGKLVFEYATGSDFVKFSQDSGDDSHSVTALSARSVSDALAAGELTESTFVTVDGKTAASEEVQKHSEYVVVTISGAATVYTEGQIAYVSTGVSMRDSFTATTPEETSYIIFK